MHPATACRDTEIPGSTGLMLSARLTPRLGERSRFMISCPLISSVAGISNVEGITGLVDDARFPKNSLDLVFMAYVFHHVDKPVPLLRSLQSSLKPGGFVAMAEPKPENTEKSARMLTRERVGQEAKEAGYQLDAVIEDRLKGDNIFILRPIVADAPESQDRQNVRPALFRYRARIGGTRAHGSCNKVRVRQKNGSRPPV